MPRIKKEANWTAFLQSKSIQPYLNLLTKWGVVLLGLLVSNGALALSLILIARRSMVAEYGQLVSSFALLTFSVILPSFGMNAWLLALKLTKPAQVRDYWRTAIRLRAMLLLAWMVGIAALSALYLPKETYPWDIMIPATLAVAFETITILSYTALRRVNRHWLISIIQSLSALALLALVVLSSPEQTTVAWFAQRRAGVAVGTALITLIIVYFQGSVHPTISISMGSILRASHTFFWAGLASTVYLRAGLTLVGLVLGSEESGIYGSALNILQITFLVPQSLYFFIVPNLTDTYANRSRRAFNRMGAGQFIAQTSAGALMFLTLLLFAPALVQLVFGEAYAQAGMVLRLLSPIPLLRSINIAFGAVLTSSQHQAHRTRIQVLVAIFNIAAILVVIQPFGVTGVVVVYVLSELFLAIGYTITTYLIFQYER